MGLAYAGLDGPVLAAGVCGYGRFHLGRIYHYHRKAEPVAFYLVILLYMSSAAPDY